MISPSIKKKRISALFTVYIVVPHVQTRPASRGVLLSSFQSSSSREIFSNVFRYGAHPSGRSEAIVLKILPPQRVQDGTQCLIFKKEKTKSSSSPRRRSRPLPRWHAVGGPHTSSSPNVHPSRCSTSHFRRPCLIGEAIAPVGGG